MGLAITLLCDTIQSQPPSMNPAPLTPPPLNFGLEGILLVLSDFREPWSIFCCFCAPVVQQGS